MASTFPSKELLAWFSTHQRPLPWRQTYDPYHVWISEIMAQQTRIEQMQPYYERFLKRFPGVKELADAEEQEVLKHWEGLGYYSRARNLHAAAKQVMANHAGKLPRTRAELHALKGFGPYISAAVASIAFQEDVPVVDGNVLRVATRMWGIKEDISTSSTRKRIETKLAEVLPRGHARAFNQGMMEVGALVCTPTHPSCESCPLRESCYAYKTHTQANLPVKTRKGKAPVKHFAMLLLRDGKKVGLIQRTSKLLQGMWEFPSVEFHPLVDATPQIEQSFAQKGNSIRLGKSRGVFSHQYSHFTQHAHVFEANANRLSAEIEFVPLSEVRKKPLSKIQSKILEAIGDSEN